ncbi:alkylhydroperoxidase AhpD family core domain-containing protein [Salipaludibacillus aurantiacus]|nr:carboxymuconolactone decarboxylase family protein [Salipaludibacillus aurantiacus]SES28726.1 alkylhydroperoxidase AhpD family core domain-containing protein [Salipaludibacillus aurantiacus]
MCARISVIEPEHATGKLSELYDQFNGKMANILKVHSLNPRSLETHLNYYKVIMFGQSPLPRSLREMIATVVSAENECDY